MAIAAERPKRVVPSKGVVGQNSSISRGIVGFYLKFLYLQLFLPLLTPQCWWL